ncbi:MAG: transposase [Clostridium sp.]
MGRKPRVWYEGAMYHITVRGNRKENIFIHYDDYIRYQQDIIETQEFYKEEESNMETYEILSYCLMTNHVHILMKCNTMKPEYFMRRLNSSYARYFNRKYNYVGHLYQERYYCDIIKDTAQLLEVSRYIHLNPVKAGIEKMPENYRWSSYRDIINNTQREISIKKDILLDYFCYGDKEAQYKEFVDSKESEIRK